MECPHSGKRWWLANACTSSSSPVTHRPVPYLRVFRETVTTRAALVLNTGASTSTRCLATEFNASRAGWSRSASSSPPPSHRAIDRGSAPVCRGTRRDYESKSPTWHRILRVLRVVDLDHRRLREPPAALRPPALRPLAFPVSAASAIAVFFAIFILGLGLGLGGLRLRWTLPSARISFPNRSTRPSQDIQRPKRSPPPPSPLPTHQQQYEPVQRQQRRGIPRSRRTHPARPLARVINTHLPLLVLVEPAPDAATRTAGSGLFAAPAAAAQAAAGDVQSPGAVRVLESAGRLPHDGQVRRVRAARAHESARARGVPCPDGRIHGPLRQLCQVRPYPQGAPRESPASGSTAPVAL